MGNREPLKNRIASFDKEKGVIENYDVIVEQIAIKLAEETNKKKRILFITGSGISLSENNDHDDINVPSMNQLVDMVCKGVEKKNPEVCFSQEFLSIFNSYEKARDAYEKEKTTSNKESEYDAQTKLLTYIQNAYLDKKEYVQDEDIIGLQEVWEGFVSELLKIIKAAEPTSIHLSIKKIMEKINETSEDNAVNNQAIVLTTNFDNLLYEAFHKDNKNFYPILDKEALERYYTSDEDDKSYIEIQSRGDVFWVECSGENNRTCQNKRKQCLVLSDRRLLDEEVKCGICGSKARVYFAFPGTKEKDAEMARVVDGIWKHISTSISMIIIVGSSMDYDPVLIEFMRELERRYNIWIVYLSRYYVGNKYKQIKNKKVTDFLFGNDLIDNAFWIQSNNTSGVLDDVLSKFDTIPHKSTKITEDEADRMRHISSTIIEKLFDDNYNTEKLKDAEDKFKSFFNKELLNISCLERLKNYSQLGLKTYWLRSDFDNIEYKLHTRYKHSFGVMAIATYIYLNKVKYPTQEELTFLQMAALLHDIGHLPFSHLMEEVFEEFGWRTPFSEKSFTHEQNTKLLLEQMYSAEDDKTFKSILDMTGYTLRDLQRLIGGEFGVGYLDALINSPIDCDKIEYLFTDAKYTERTAQYKIMTFLRDYVSEDLCISGCGNFMIKGKSTKAVLNLINLRGKMYDNIYYRGGLRYLESCCKLIIRTSFSYKCADNNFFEEITSKKDYSDFIDLSDYKIKASKNYLENPEFCKDETGENTVCEMRILKNMIDEIKSQKSIVNSQMKESLYKCFRKIETTKRNDIESIELNLIKIFEVSKNVDKKQLRKLIKDLYLRFPGVILIDYIESKSSFSFGKRDSGMLRSDGTKSPTENILIKDIQQIKGHIDKEYMCLGDAVELVNKELKYSNHSYIYLHRITSNLFSYMQAEDLIVDELRKEGIIDG